MIYLRWLASTLLDWALLIPPALYLLPMGVDGWYWGLLSFWWWGAVITSLFTKAGPDIHGYGHGLLYRLFGTYDNPPQGDEGWVERRCPFPNVTTGWKGYVNRVLWLTRNPGYPLAVKLAIPYNEGFTSKVSGVSYGTHDRILVSDKYGLGGWFLSRRYLDGKLVVFEFYAVIPYRWKLDRCLRFRAGWKVETRKFKSFGFAQLVNTIHPYKKYGASS